MVRTSPICTNLLRQSFTRGFASMTGAATKEGPAQLLNSMAALRLQPRQFAKMRIDGKAYTITNGDVIHLPTRLKNTSVGDTLRLTHAIMVGSRDFTIRGQPFVKEDLFECSATVIEHTKQPMLRTIKKKRRNRHAKLVESKQPYTVLRINKIQIHEPTAVTDRKQL